ncbi:MAG: 50S ribosomal protein L7/L12 [Anaerolineales bacterium]|nr:50S ribosomal protein L7/L12 [Anaerolineales bacterium]
MPNLQPQHVQEIHQLLEERKVIEAIKVYREATGVGLAEAKRAIETMFQNEIMKPPADVRSYDNPVLESKIRSLLAKGKKIDAVKIYSEEYGVGLKEAKDAVERIEATMPRDSAQGMPYESAIGSDPFAQDDGSGKRVVFLLAGVVALAVCALAVVIILFGV